jgi:hypothetical protein
MRINLITKEEYTHLLNIFNNNPILTLQNKGYETPNEKEFSEDDKQSKIEVTAILKNAVHGFSSFTNFRLNKNQQIEIRLQYNYSYDGNGIPFIGVGYILLDELLNGFEKK